jgi:mono/diheme cytochrome c family protein
MENSIKINNDLINLLLSTFCILGICGCHNSTAKTDDPRVLYQQHCAGCHAQAGEPGGPAVGASRGPNLADLGRRRAPEWVADYIRQPINRRPNARMPAFAGTFSEEQIRTLAAYLCRRP